MTQKPWRQTWWWKKFSLTSEITFGKWCRTYFKLLIIDVKTESVWLYLVCRTCSCNENFTAFTVKHWYMLWSDAAVIKALKSFMCFSSFEWCLQHPKEDKKKKQLSNLTLIRNQYKNWVHSLNSWKHNQVKNQHYINTTLQTLQHLRLNIKDKSFLQ